MSYNYGFFDNQLIGVDHLNAITERLVGKGVGIDPENISDFNDINQSVVSGGVVPDTVLSLKVTKNETGVLINPGIAFFDDGTFIEITDVEEFPLTSGEINYVYLKSSFSENRAYPVCSVTEPDDKDVLLAIVKEDGSILDKRVYAKGKAAFYGNDDVYNHKVSYYITPDTQDEYNNSAAKTIKLYCDTSFYDKIIFESGEYKDYSPGYARPQNNYAIYSVGDGKCFSFGTTGSTDTVSEWSMLKVYGYWGYTWNATVTKQDDGFLVELSGDPVTGYAQSPISFDLNITLIAKGRNDL